MRLDRLLGISVVAIILALISSTNCQNVSNYTNPLTHSINNFALKFYRAVNNLSENVFFSPLSISLIYSMLLRGARGLTAQQIIDTFEFRNFNNPDDIHKNFQALIFDYKMVELNNIVRNFTMKLANLVLTDKKFPLTKDYANTLLNEYQSTVAEEDFAGKGQDVMLRVNKWIAAKTKNKIPTLIDQPFTESTALLLVNAIFFEGNWLKPFQRSATYAKPFYNYDSTLGDVEMMTNIGLYRYGEVWNMNLKIIELPFEGNISMYILLPINNYSLKYIMSKMTSEEFQDILATLTTQKVEIQFPKFRLEGSYDLSKILFSMGLYLPFTTRTDLFGISHSNNLHVTDSTHMAIIQISEEGPHDEKSFGFSLAELYFNSGPKFVCDRPFGFIIRDNFNQVDLFMGSISKL